MNALRVNSACSLCFVVFGIFPVRCFCLRSLRIHDGVFFVYIYIRYIYILGFVCDVLTGAFAHVNKFFVTHIRWFVCEVLARWF